MGRARAHRGEPGAWARAGRGERAWASLGCACLGCVCLVAACKKDPVITTRAVTLHAPQSCAPGLSSLDASAFAVYHALGDYEPAAPADGHPLTMGLALPEIDPAARELLVDATDEQDREWEGLSPLAPAGPLDVLLLPATTPCALRGTVVDAAGSVIGMTGSRQALLVGSTGGAPGSSASAAPGATVLGLDTGAVTTLPGSARTGATVTHFGVGALVAGGVAGPVSSSSVVLDRADVYDPALGGFGPSIALTGPREDAGAVVLATGETLLVGGAGKDGALLGSMEIVDPVTRKARLAAATLAVARRAPMVLRLASGEVFVAGGVDANGASVPTLEWFASDASQATKRTQDLVAESSPRSFVALDAGGVLAVVAPPSGALATFQNTWVINADGELEAATPIEGALAEPVLLGSAGGAPVLWTGAITGGAPGRWLRWQPWVGAFAPLDVLDDIGGRILGAASSPDPGMALWLDTTTTPGTPRLSALRFDVRGEYSTLSGPLLLSDTTDMAPDRLATDGMASFDPGPGGGLTLTPSASTQQSSGSAFVTDRTYADVRIEVDAPTGEPALVVLRDGLGDEMEVGGAGCLGAVVVTMGTSSSLTVERRGTSLTWAVSGGPSSTCSLGFDAGARVSVGLRAAPGLVHSVANNLRVTRLGQP